MRAYSIPFFIIFSFCYKHMVPQSMCLPLLPSFSSSLRRFFVKAIKNGAFSRENAPLLFLLLLFFLSASSLLLLSFSLSRLFCFFLFLLSALLFLPFVPSLIQAITHQGRQPGGKGRPDGDGNEDDDVAGDVRKGMLKDLNDRHTIYLVAGI